MSTMLPRESEKSDGEAVESLEAAIYDRIHTAIFERKLAPGARLVEEQLAEIFGVGRSRIRMVLQLLARDKIVILHRNKGAAVAHPSITEARDVFAARRLIEVSLARQISELKDDRALRRLKSHLRKEAAAERRGDRAVVMRTSHEFHVLLGEIVGNPVITGVLKELLVRSSLITAIYERRDIQGCLLCDHRRLIELIEEGNPDRLAKGMHDHLTEVEGNLVLAEKKEAVLGLHEIFAL